MLILLIVVLRLEGNGDCPVDVEVEEEDVKYGFWESRRYFQIQIHDQSEHDKERCLLREGKNDRVSRLMSLYTAPNYTFLWRNP